MTRRIVLVGVSLGLSLSLLFGCAAPTGGWDLDRLLADHPAIASLPHQRIGDMTPYPAWRDGQLVAVVCRFDSPEPIPIRGDGPGWQAAWARAAVAAVDRGVEGVGLILVDQADNTGGSVRPPAIEIESIEAPQAAGPGGLGDTIAFCDVSPTREGAVRGVVYGATIRIRRTLPLPTGRVHHADRAEWTGALLHELGHALGFAGHAAIGDSIVHLEQSRLRVLGRRAAASEPFSMPTISALYQIEPGRLLLEPDVESSAQDAIRSVLALVEARRQRLGPPERVISIAGDENARLVWSWQGGVTAALDFPDWRKAISSGDPVRADPSASTRRAIKATR